MQKPPSDKTHGGVEIVHVLLKKKKQKKKQRVIGQELTYKQISP